MLSQKFKEDALRALEDMSAEELVRVLKKIGSVQESTVSIEITLRRPSKFSVIIKEKVLPDTEQQIIMKKTLRYQFDLPKTVDVLSQWGEAA
jgi:hypothetical protein